MWVVGEIVAKAAVALEVDEAGGEITAVCSHRHIDRLYAIGADHVIDYMKEDFTQNGQLYDLILDTKTNGIVESKTSNTFSMALSFRYNIILKLSD